MFTAALFTIAKLGNSPHAPLLMMMMWCTYTMEFYSAIKKKNVVCRQMGETGERHVKQSEPISKSQRSSVFPLEARPIT
jgi:hypothetical protein